MELKGTSVSVPDQVVPGRAPWTRLDGEGLGWAQRECLGPATLPARRAPTQTHARVPRPRRAHAPQAPAAATGARAVLAAPTPLPPLARIAPAAPHDRPADSGEGGGRGRWAPSGRSARGGGAVSEAEPGESPGGRCGQARAPA